MQIPSRSIARAAAHDATPWGLVLLAVAAGMIGACQIGKAAIALPALRLDLGIGLAAAGWVLSILNLVGLLGGTALGVAVGASGDRRMLIGGLALIALSGLAGAFAPGLASLLATRFFEGVGFLLVIIGAPSLIARLVRPQDAALAFGIWAAYMPAGQSLMMLAAPALLEPFGWRGLWLGNAILAAAFAAALAWATRRLPPAPYRPARSQWRDLRDTAAAPEPLLLAVIFAVYALQILAVMGFLPTILVELQHLTPLAAGELAALAVAMNGVGNVVGGLLLKRGIARSRLVAIAALAMGFCELGIFLWALPLAATYALYLLFSGLGGVIPAAVLGAAPEAAPAPHLVPATNGLLVQGSNLGQVMGPPAVGALAASMGDWRSSPLIVTTAAAVALILGLALRRREHARRS